MKRLAELDKNIRELLEQTAKDYDMRVEDVKTVYDIHGLDNLYPALEDYLTLRRSCY